ncbi:hypothetical protein B0H13DRAFT_2672998 [Mycena leptocephala]|nr:hypothetical protein B0H13DRAFT_2672998 [Mycena leptocephala]
MHPALTISELLYLIFAEIKRSPRLFEPCDMPDLPSLAAVARTCTGFRDPALDLLWRHQDTMKDFLSCFPRDLTTANVLGCKKGGVGVVAGVYFPNPATEADWERPRLYSRRVKILCLDYRDEWFDRTSMEEFEKIFVNFLGPLFPNLAKLTLTFPGDTYVRFLDILLSPRIKDIALHFSSGPLLSQVVPTLGERCPLLTKADILLRLPLFQYVPAELQSVSTFVRSLRGIECLTVHDLDREAFMHLGRLPTLMTLKLEDAQIPAVSLPPGDHLFSSLTSIEFQKTTVSRVIAFIKSTMNCPLERLKIDLINDLSPRSAVEQLYSALAARCSHIALQTLKIPAGYWPDDADAALFSITGDVLRHLFCFKNMVTVSLGQPFGFNLHDGDIFDLTSSWPRLEFLVLKGLKHAPSRVTLRALYAFAQHCPNLRFLAITLDATGISGLETDASDARACQTSLKQISLGYSPIATATPVAAFLSATFPKLTGISSAYNDEAESESEEALYKDRWEEVEQLLRQSSAG